MRACVFVGPSASNVELPVGVDRFTPAVLGSVWQAVQLGYQRIAIVDGLFGMVPSVWHKEVLYALSHGVEVLGASSMGALRAAELAPFGMVGIGVIFRLYRAGVLADDDEVCLIHTPAEDGFVPLSLPMVCIRSALGAMVRRGQLERGAARQVCRTMKRLHFAERTRPRLLEALNEATSDSRVREWLDQAYRDLKAADYQRLACVITAPPRSHRSALLWEDVSTRVWRHQFERESRDIPKLQRW